MQVLFMETKHTSKIWILVTLLLFIAGVLSVRAYAYTHTGRELRVVALNIGQGDSFYIEAPNGRQMVIDGGPDRSIISELQKVMPFGDRSIDVLVVTNPDKDHYGGFLNVLDSYEVGMVLEPGTVSTTATYQELENKIAEKKIPDLVARKGMHVTLDQSKNIYFEILFPDQDVTTWSSNDGSIVGKIVFGATSFMMMGDATAKTEAHILATTDLGVIKSTVLKAGHHGSRTSSSSAWVAAVSPYYTLISAGVHNSYGHPHKETLATLAEYHSEVLGTYTRGTIELDTDGVSVWLK
jgi:competence protein ComEC